MAGDMTTAHTVKNNQVAPIRVPPSPMITCFHCVRERNRGYVLFGAKIGTMPNAGVVRVGACAVRNDPDLDMHSLSITFHSKDTSMQWCVY